MQQMYVTNLNELDENADERTFELHRIADWLTVIAEEMRYANAMTRAGIDGHGAAWLREQGY